MGLPSSLTYTQLPQAEAYSEIIDVRSPSEFAEDRIPGAVNLPVLSDTERAKVGTIYKQVCPFTARKVGAALVAQNVAQHLESHFAAKDKDYHPLVYCWRGGQRSQSMAQILAQIGWRVTLLQGGYKTYRSFVRDQLEQVPNKFTYRVLCGLTGSGKTHILRQMAAMGFQVLDLEGLANHRGSLLGQEWEPRRWGDGEQIASNSSAALSPPCPSAQPSQKYFESLLLQNLERLDAGKAVWLEAESNKIGCVYLPKSLWEKMKQASCVEVQVPLEARTQWLLQQYPHFKTHPEILKAKLQHLKSRHGREKIHEWYHLIDAGQWKSLVNDLLVSHYDPTYTQSMHRYFSQVEKVLPLADLSDTSVNELLESLYNLR